MNIIFAFLRETAVFSVVNAFFPETRVVRESR